jgi:hypothetical protein
MTYCPFPSWHGSAPIKTVAITSSIFILSLLREHRIVLYKLHKKISRDRPVSLLYRSYYNSRVAPGSAGAGPASCRRSADEPQPRNGWRLPGAVRRGACEPGITLRVWHAPRLACSWSGEGQNRPFQRRYPDQQPAPHRFGMARADAPPAGGTGIPVPAGFHCKTPVQPTTVTEVRSAR